jgi:hypothetical protein
VGRHRLDKGKSTGTSRLKAQDQAEPADAEPLPRRAALAITSEDLEGRPAQGGGVPTPRTAIWRFRMVYRRQLQATHCSGALAWKGAWRDRTGKSWYIEACRELAA